MSQQEQPSDSVDHPPHYTFGNIEVIDAIEAWNLGFHLGNAVKYLARAAHKGNFIQDLRKARWYIDRQIQVAGRWDLEQQSAEKKEGV